MDIGEIQLVDIEKEMREAYLDYAMSVITSRALPDVRDGLKPVQRRILYTMYDNGLRPDRPFRKSAATVGDVLGKYHPHGDSAVYDAMVRMAQDFSLPYLLVNGASGIAVGMATNIPPHNLGEVCDALVYLIDHHDQIDDVSLDDLMHFIPGPDFPTGASIVGLEGIRNAYATGRGRVIMRASAHFEEFKDDRVAIIVDALPFQVNKATLVERIADLARSKRIETISDLRDETDRRGMRVVIELKRGANPTVTLNQLMKYSQL